MKKEKERSLWNMLTILAVATVIVFGSIVAWPNYRRGELLRIKEAELSERILAKRAEIDELIENQRRFRTDSDFVEMIARQNRRVFPGELVFVFED